MTPEQQKALALAKARRRRQEASASSVDAEIAANAASIGIQPGQKGEAVIRALLMQNGN